MANKTGGRRLYRSKLICLISIVIVTCSLLASIGDAYTMTDPATLFVRGPLWDHGTLTPLVHTMTSAAR